MFTKQSESFKCPAMAWAKDDFPVPGGP
jgi:hypothetical protein